MNTTPENIGSWRLGRGERIGLAVALCALLAFGVNLEFRTALRRTPMTDLGVFSAASGAIRSGDNPYNITDWHGWHYQYPPTFAILFTPLSIPVPVPPPPRAPGEPRTKENTPWGYGIDGSGKFYGLDAQNERFFWIVAIWYVISVLLICLSAHALACTLEGSGLRAPPPTVPVKRRRWWALRTLPMLICITSLGTDLSRGQVDVVMLAAVSVGLYLAASRQDFKSGLSLAFPATVKLFPPLLLLYPIWRRRWRLTLGVVVGLILFLLVLPGATLGPDRTAELYRLWIDVLAKPALGQGTDTSRLHELTGMGATDNQSLLSFIHNWRYHSLPRTERPAEATPQDRYAVYVIGSLMLVGIGVVAGWRRRDQPQELLIIAGMLVGLTFILSPIVHNFYYLVLLPLFAGLTDHCLGDGAKPVRDNKVLTVLVVFMLTDILARLPGIGHALRDIGLPILTMVAVMCAGAVVLLKKDASPVVDTH